jgi:hypothetical protein
MSLSRSEMAERMARAHSNLNAHSSIIAILEGGHVYNTGRTSDRRDEIIAICKSEMQMELRIYDRMRRALLKEGE